MNKNSFQTGQRLAKILAVLAIAACVAAQIAPNPAAQIVLGIMTLLLYVSIFVVIAVLCRCPSCGKVVAFGVWSATTCPRCRRSLITGNTVKGKK